MKKETRTPPPAGDDFEAFEEWEDVSSKEPPKDTVITKTPEAPKPKAPPKPAKPPAIPATDEVLHMSADVPVHLVAVIGRTTVSVKDMMNFQMGHVIDLGRPPGETVDLVASGKLFARGELVDIDGKLGVRIVKLVR